MKKVIYKKRREIKDIKDMLNSSVELYAKEPAYKFKTDKENEFKIITYQDLLDDVNGLGTALMNIGLEGQRIAVISENRYEWAVSYLAVTCGTGIVVPLDKALPANEIESLIIRSGVQAIFFSSKYNDIMKDIKARNTTDLRYYISMDISEKTDWMYSQEEFIQKGKDLIQKGNRKFLDATIDNEKMSIMLFTSGTTAMSKAVQLSQKNICTNIMDIASVIKLTPEDTLLSFLPLHHTFECTVGFLYVLYSGASIAFCEGIRHIADNIREYKITAMISVPVLFENMYKKLIKNIEKKGLIEKVESGIKLGNFLAKIGVDVKRKIFKEIHESLGGKLRLFVNGAAALDPVVEKGFNDLGIKIVQGYGLTETSPVVSAGNDKYSRIGSVGRVFPSLKVKIADKNENGIGEIMVKGPSVMLGYYQNEEATNEVLKGGWFYTGDLGYLDKDGFLYIAGRKKNVIVLKNGKNIYPEELEAVINRIEGVKESFVYGKPDSDDDLKICTKIVYDPEIMKQTYQIEGQEAILEKLWEKIKEINKTMPAYKYIREVIATEEELIKTTTQKVKRFEELKKIEADEKKA